MAGDPEGLVEFKAGSKKYRLFFGMRAMKAAESHYDKPLFHIIQSAMPDLSPEDMADPAKVAEASASIRLTDLGKLFEFAMLKHQPEIEETDVDDLIDAIGVAKASDLLGQTLGAAMVDGGGDDTANPPPASQKKKTGSR